jgi:hypothetical protein
LKYKYAPGKIITLELYIVTDLLLEAPFFTKEGTEKSRALTYTNIYGMTGALFY